MDILAIQAALTSLKTATDIVISLHDMKTSAEVQSKIIDLQRALLAAQGCAMTATNAQFELQMKVKELEDQLATINDWSAEKSRYALVSPWRGAAQAYALKKSASEGEEPHLICPTCFSSGSRSFLNPNKRDGWVVLSCVRCKTTIETGYKGIGKPEFAEDYLQKPN